MGPRHGLLAREPAPSRPQTRAGRKIDLYDTGAVDGSSARVGTCGLYDLAEAVASGPQATYQSLEGDGRTRVNLITQCIAAIRSRKVSAKHRLPGCQDRLI